MRTAAILGIVSLAMFAAACEAPKQTTKKSTPNAAQNNDDNDESAIDPGDEDPFASTPTPTPTGADRDSDGVADDVDCDPNSSTVAATRLLDDPLSTDKSFFTVADGFKAQSWSYDGTVFNQTGLDTVNAKVGELTLFNKDAQIGDVSVEVTAKSFEVANGFTGGDRHRQLLVTLGTRLTGGTVNALGCGFELMGTAPVVRQTTIVRLSGTATDILSTPIANVGQSPLTTDEEFKITATLKAGTLTCAVTRGADVKTATANNLTDTVGAVGLFMRQNKGKFRTMKICKAKT